MRGLGEEKDKDQLAAVGTSSGLLVDVCVVFLWALYCVVLCCAVLRCVVL